MGKFVWEIRSMPASEYLDWVRYASEYPFGPVRDNLHAAMIAAEVRRPWVKKGTQVKLSNFMVMSQDQRRAARTADTVSMLKAMATRGKHGSGSGKAGRKARTAKRPVSKRTGPGE